MSALAKRVCLENCSETQKPVLTSNFNACEARKTQFSGATRPTRKLTPDCIPDIWLRISPWDDQFSVPLRGAGSPLRTSAAQTQSLCPGSPFDPRRRTSLLYWNGHYLRGILPLGSNTVKDSNNVFKKIYFNQFSHCLSPYYRFSLIWTSFLFTESSLSSWCKNWARSSGVVPSIPCSCRYWIPLFGFLLNLFVAQKTQTEFYYRSLKKNTKGRSYKVKRVNVQVDALLNYFFLLFEHLKLLWVVSAWHLGAVAADSRRGRGVQWVDAPIAVDGFWSLGVSVFLFWWFLLAWRVIMYNNYIKKTLIFWQWGYQVTCLQVYCWEPQKSCT